MVESKRKRVTMVPGDGVGPELMSSVQSVFSAIGVPVDFEEVLARCVCLLMLFDSLCQGFGRLNGAEVSMPLATYHNINTPSIF